jgi:AcrR family transcriptional regulator
MSAAAPDRPTALERPPPGPFAGRPPESGLPGFLRGSPVGREQLSAEAVARSHRNRMMLGAVKVVGESGFYDSKVESIISAGGVSRNTFYRHFADKRACLLAAYETTVAWLEEEATRAIAAEACWADKVRVAGESTLSLLAGDPHLARLVALEILCLGPAGQARQRALIDRLSRPLRLGRVVDPLPYEFSPGLELALLSGAISMIGREVNEGRGERLGGLAPALTEFLLVPYLGRAEALRVATSRPAAPCR